MPDGGASSAVAGWLTAALVGLASAVKILIDWRGARSAASKASADAVDARTRAGDSTFTQLERFGKTQADRNESLEKEVGRLRSEVIRLEAQADALAAQILRYGVAKLAEEMASPGDATLAVLDEMPIGFAVTRSDSGRFIVANSSFCALLGRSRAELLAGRWRDWIVPEDEDRTAIVESLALDRPVEIENGYTRPDGSVVKLHWVAGRYTKFGITISYVREVES